MTDKGRRERGSLWRQIEEKFWLTSEVNFGLNCYQIAWSITILGSLNGTLNSEFLEELKSILIYKRETRRENTSFYNNFGQNFWETWGTWRFLIQTGNERLTTRWAFFGENTPFQAIWSQKSLGRSSPNWPLVGQSSHAPGRDCIEISSKLPKSFLFSEES